MEPALNIKHEICSLFEVHQDDKGVQRVVTPLEYAGSGDKIVVRVRPFEDGVRIDENGEAAFYASMAGGDTENGAALRWLEDLPLTTPVRYNDEEELWVCTKDERLIAPYIFRVADAAQQFHAIATARADRSANDFKERVTAIIKDVAASLAIGVQSDVELPIMGNLKADHVLNTRKPLIVVIATTAARLMEAQLIQMEYRVEKKLGAVLAIAESQASVGRKQFERAGYFTDRTVIFDQSALTQLLTQAASEPA